MIDGLISVVYITRAHEELNNCRFYWQYLHANQIARFRGRCLIYDLFIDTAT